MHRRHGRGRGEQGVDFIPLRRRRENTEKFEGLITRCVRELPQKEKQLADIQRRIEQERERLFRIQKATEELRRLEQDIQTAQHYFSIVERRAKAIAEAAEKNGA